LRSFKAVFFDVDGTLYRNDDYEQHLLRKVVEVLSEFLGVSYAEAFKRLAEVKGRVKTVSKSVELMGVDRHVFYERLAQEVEPEKYISRSDKVVETLRRIRARGLFVGLHTNSGRSLAKRILGCIGVDESCYDLLVTSDDADPKPNHEGFLLLLMKAQCSPREALYVGDRCEIEIIPAKQLGMATAFVGKKECAYADFYLNEVYDVLKLI